MSFHADSIAQVLADVQSQEQGLTAAEAAERLQRFGHNNLSASRARSSNLAIFFSQWKNPLIVILAVAFVISLFLHDPIDAAVIGFTIVVNVMVGFFQEHKANTALQKLQTMVVFFSNVRRGGEVVPVDSRDVTIGDVIFLEAGDKIPADARLLQTVALEVNESMLTGESKSVDKSCNRVSESAPLAERTNMVYQGTHVVNGRGQAVVAAVGKNTEMGRIAQLVATTNDAKTPLQQQLAALSRGIAYIVAGIAAAVFIIGFVRGNVYQPLVVFQTAVALAVAAIPDGLPISLTVILAIGMQFILKRKGLVRRLVSAETLGSVTVICTDKTGTLTEGIMSVTRLMTHGRELTREDCRQPSVAKPEDQGAIMALKIAAQCNNVTSSRDDAGVTVFRGDTTEVALADGALSAGLSKTALDIAVPRLAEIPFDSRKKYMATLHQIELEKVIYVKGAYDILRDRITHSERNGERKKITKTDWAQFDQAVLDMSQHGLRVLALAYKLADHHTASLAETDVSDLTLVGVIGLSDPVRSSVKESIQKAQQAGIKIIMITGDEQNTATAVGKELGITTVYARVNPEDKIRIVAELRQQGEVVAMTGDGVNDAPALKGADIGVAMGAGTDIAKEIADLVLLDNRFETIVAAIEEGRGMFQNIRKVVVYLLAFSLGEVVLIAGSLLAGLPLALLPSQILWLNLVQDTFPAIALAFDRPHAGTMSEPPRGRNAKLIGPYEARLVTITMTVTSLLLMGMYWYGLQVSVDQAMLRSMLFTALGIASIISVYSVRSNGGGLFSMPLFANRYLNGAVVLGVGLLLLALYFPPLQFITHTTGLSAFGWGLVIGFNCGTMLIIEGIKFLLRKFYVQPRLYVPQPAQNQSA